MSVLSKPYFHDEAAAFAKLESIVWPHGPVCPHCGGKERVYALEGVKDKKGRVRPGLKKCGHCRKQFTVRVGTVFESSHVPLYKWLQATHLMCSSKKGISAHQLHRILEVTYKTAWFMAHRLREAMRDGELAPMGGAGEIVEADETYFGNRETITTRTKRGKSGLASKRPVLALVQRGGKVRSFQVDRATKNNVRDVVMANIDRETRVFTDESKLYGDVKAHFKEHGTVRHSINEYVVGEVHTNTIEGVFSIFKRGMKGVYQHCSEKHLHRYLAEFDFRYNNRSATGVNDSERVWNALSGISGKRLTYRVVDQA